MKTKTFLARLPLILAMTLPVAAWARSGDVTADVPGVEDSPALSPEASKTLGLGFADIHGISGMGDDGNGVTLTEERADGKVLKLEMDPISGELKQR